MSKPQLLDPQLASKILRPIKDEDLQLPKFMHEHFLPAKRAEADARRRFWKAIFPNLTK